MKKFSARKLFLDLLVIVCLGVAGWIGYQLFILHQLNPIIGSIVFIVDIGVLVWSISVLRSRQYSWRAPSFKAVFFSILGILLVLSFAGVQPMAEYKDRVISLFENSSESPEPEVLLIPYGRYTYTLGVLYDSITLKADGSYYAEGAISPFTVEPSGLSSVDRGTYEVDNFYLSITSGTTGKTRRYEYRYSAEFGCLYIYLYSWSNTPTPFYRD